jgi:hypothetical protein
VEDEEGNGHDLERVPSSTEACAAYRLLNHSHTYTVSEHDKQNVLDLELAVCDLNLKDFS